jgi:hypothetical protein
MTYAYDFENGQRLLVQNDGDDTQVALSSGDSGQKQNQSTGFNTGGWSKPPELFRTSENLVLRLESKSGTERDPDAGVKWDTNTVRLFVCRFRNYASTIAVVWPRIFTVWFNCSILSGFFKTVTGLICKILSSISLSG